MRNTIFVVINTFFTLFAILLQRQLYTNALVVPAPFLVNTGIGAIAGGVGALTVYPIDFVKTQLQTEEGKEQYKDGVDAFSTILSEGGPLALYRGAGTQVVGVAPEKTIKLLVNDAARASITAALGRLPLCGEIAAGMCAGACQVIVTNPLEVLKVGLQTSSLSISELAKEVGLKGLYRGGLSCVYRDASFSAILFPLYAHAKTVLPLLLVGNDGPVVLAMAGLLAATPAAYLTTPFDVIKTRQQSLRKAAAASGNQEEETIENRGTFQVASDIASKEGYTVFFSGGIERVLRSAPQFGVTLALFDVLKGIAIDHGLLPMM